MKACGWNCCGATGAACGATAGCTAGAGATGTETGCGGRTGVPTEALEEPKPWSAGGAATVGWSNDASVLSAAAEAYETVALGAGTVEPVRSCAESATCQAVFGGWSGVGTRASAAEPAVQ